MATQRARPTRRWLLAAAGSALLSGMACVETIARNANDMTFRGHLRPAFDPAQCGLEHFGESASFPAAETVWLAAGERVCVYWEELTVVAERVDDPDEVQTCPFCGSSPEGDCAATYPGAGTASDIAPSVELFEAPFPIFDLVDRVAAFGWRTGCLTNEEYPFPTFVPERNAELTFGAKAGTLTRAGQGFSVVLVPKAGELQMPPRLLSSAPSDDPQKVLWKWGVTLGEDGRWSENFSPNVRITRIQVVRGRVEQRRRPDSVGQISMTHLVDTSFVVPYTLEFGPNLDCDGEAGTEDGNIDPTNCRDGDTLKIRKVTPAYELFEDGRPPARIEWTIEFRDRPGFGIPQLAEGEALGVVFTLKQVPL